MLMLICVRADRMWKSFVRAKKLLKLNLTCIMTTKQLKKENDSLKAQLEELTKEISVLKATTSNAEAANDRSRHDGVNRCSS